jgi:hypothetical protein
MPATSMEARSDAWRARTCNPPKADSIRVHVAVQRDEHLAGWMHDGESRTAPGTCANATNAVSITEEFPRTAFSMKSPLGQRCARRFNRSSHDVYWGVSGAARQLTAPRVIRLHGTGSYNSLLGGAALTNPERYSANFSVWRRISGTAVISHNAPFVTGPTANSRREIAPCRLSNAQLPVTFKPSRRGWGRTTPSARRSRIRDRIVVGAWASTIGTDNGNCGHQRSTAFRAAIS